MADWLAWTRSFDADRREMAERGKCSMGPRLLPSLIDLLADSPSAMTRSDAAHELARHAVHAGLVTGHLLVALEDEDKLVRACAASTLGAFGRADPTVVAALARRLTDAESLPRRAAAEALAKLAPEIESALPALTELVRRVDCSEGGRIEACNALAAMGAKAEAAIPTLAATLEHAPDEWNRSVIIRALDGVGVPHPAALAALRSALDAEDESSIDAARAYFALTSDPGPVLPVLRRWLGQEGGGDALLGLGEMGPDAAPLVEDVRMLLSREADCGTTAAWALWRITGTPEPVLPTLEEALKEQRCRMEAAGVLAEMGPRARAALPTIMAVMEEIALEESWVRSYYGERLKAALDGETVTFDEPERLSREPRCLEGLLVASPAPPHYQ